MRLRLLRASLSEYAGRYRITHGISPTVMMLNNTAVTGAVLVCMPYIPYPGYMKVSSHLHRSVHMRVERVSLSLVRTCIGIGVWQPATVISGQEEAVVLRRQRHGGVYSVDPVAVARRTARRTVKWALAEVED